MHPSIIQILSPGIGLPVSDLDGEADQALVMAGLGARFAAIKSPIDGNKGWVISGIQQL
jgi:hypothetical protein